jgi:hypothetical protein
MLYVRRLYQVRTSFAQMQIIFSIRYQNVQVRGYILQDLPSMGRNLRGIKNSVNVVTRAVETILNPVALDSRTLRTRTQTRSTHTLLKRGQLC